MANSLSASFPEIWGKEMQEVFYKMNVAYKIADISFKGQMKQGDTLNRPYRSTLTAQTYTPGTAITIDDLTDSQEYLTIDKKFATGFYVDDFDSIQSMYDIAIKYGKDAGELLSNKIDAYTLGEVVNAASYVDAGNVGGTAGQGISLTTSNAIPMLAGIKKALKKKNISSTNLFGVISPEVESILTQYIEGRDTPMGDKVGENGYIGMYYGFKFYVSNQLASSAVLALATTPTNTDPVVINGVTFQFVSSISTAAGNVLIDGSADNARANLTALINAPGTTTANGVALSAANQRLLEGVTAVNDASANTMTVTAKGVGVLDVSETLSDGTDTWTAATQLQRNFFGVIGNPVLVVQREPSIAVRPVQDKLGNNYLNGVLFGVKTFVDNGKQMVDARVRCDTRNA